MNQKIYSLLISFFVGFFSYSQTKVADSVSSENNRQMFIGIDLLNPGVSFFSDKKNFNGYISYKMKDRWFLIAEVGYEKNIYKKNDWNVEGKGIYGEAGINYILSNNYEATGEGFYIGGRLGFSPYKQKVNQYPVKMMDAEGQVQIVGEGSLPEASVSSAWFSAVAGAKVQIGKSPFYIDFMIKPKFILFSRKQEGTDNLVIPGYGKEKGAINVSLFWGVSYKLF